MRTRTAIRSKLVLAFVVALIPLVALQGIVLSRWRSIRVESVIQGRTDSARLVASTFESYVRDAVHESNALESILRRENAFGDPAEIQRVLTELEIYPEAVDAYGVADASGRIVAGEPEDYRGVYIGDRQYFKELRAGRPWALSGLMKSRLTETATFIIANSVRNPQGELRGVVLAQVDMDRISTLFPERIERGEILLFDRNGMLVYGSRMSDIPWEKRDWSENDLVKEALAGRTACSRSFISPTTGGRAMGCLVPVSDTGWVAGSTMPVREALAPLHGWTSPILIGTALAVIASVILVWLLGSYLTRPIVRLTRATHDFAAGRNVPPVKIETGDELQELYESFDSMKGQIAEREARLEELAGNNERLARAAEARAAELDTVLENIPAGVVIADATEGKIVRTNAAADEITGWPTPPGLRMEEVSQVIHFLKPTGEPLPIEDLPLVRAIQEKRTIVGDELLVERPDGTRITVLAFASPVGFVGGSVASAVAVFQDISEQKRKEERERTIAESLQESLMPTVLREYPAFEVGSQYLAALEEARVGGDFVDVFEVAADRLAVVIGDVSGKGLSAAVEVAMTKYYIRAYVREHQDDLGLVFAHVNDAMISDGSEERFVTVFLGVIDRQSRFLEYVSAGHEPQMIRRRESVEELRPTGLALGIFPGTYRQERVKLEADDLLVLCTDGATEARSLDGAMLEIEGLKHLLAGIEQQGAKAVCDALFDSIVDFSAGKPRDDIALLVIGFHRD
ncbi:MAG: SpoIIE family protein phosphatase [Armatimonadetes bacterium]|nr:SpoIIE family protein phosphatase [Armatimonadota bacterium]